MPTVLLITGVSRFLGVRAAAALAADPGIDRIIGIDTVPPRPQDLPLLGRTEFVRADIRNPLIAKVITRARVSVVLHAGLMAAQRTTAGRAAMQEMNVIGTMQLLAACQKSDTVARVVVKSTAAVYGSGPAEPAVFAEAAVFADVDRRAAGLDGGYARDAAEIEGYVRGFARRRPDVAVSVLRLAPVLGPTIDTALARYLSGPVVPSVLGYDPRLQLLHEDDAVTALRLAAVGDQRGPTNVAADGVVTLSQAVRRLGRIRLPVAGPLVAAVGALTGNAGAADVLAEDPRLLDHGRVVDTAALHDVFGFTPRHTTAETLEDFHSAHRPVPTLTRTGIAVGSRLMQARTPARARV